MSVMAGPAISTLTARRLDDGRTALATEVRNIGGRALDMSGEMLDNGPGGLQAGPFQAAVGTTIAPGGTSPVTIPLDGKLPLGPWSARVTLRSGLVEHSVTTTVAFPKERGASHRYLVGGYSTAWYALAAGIGGALILATILLVAVRRRRRRRASAGADLGSGAGDLGVLGETAGADPAPPAQVSPQPTCRPAPIHPRRSWPYDGVLVRPPTCRAPAVGTGCSAGAGVLKGDPGDMAGPVGFGQPRC